MNVAALRVGADPELWRALGFQVSEQGIAMLGGVRVELQPSATPGRIESWALDAVDVPESIDGLSTDAGARSEAEVEHPNGAVGIDHLVVFTPSLERTTKAFAGIGVERRRVRDAGGGVRQGFFVLRNLLVEIVEGTGLKPDAPARFWGITAVVSDIDHAADLLGERLGSIKDAVQPGRRIATVRSEASGGLPLALITPRG